MKSPKLRCRIEEEIIDELRDAVAFVQSREGKHHRTTVSGEIETALRSRILYLRRKHGVARRFPRARGKLRKGRPRKEG